MFDLIKNSYLIYGIIVLAAAIQGGFKGSAVSVLAGGILGVLIVAGGAFLGAKPEPKLTAGLICGLIGALGVAGKFLPDFFKKGYVIWPAGVLGFLAVACVALSIAGFVKK
ncbi:MAG: hypothetical protein ABMA13_12280 [Chthoniobacteraceae bacterium]